MYGSPFKLINACLKPFCAHVEWIHFSAKWCFKMKKIACGDVVGGSDWCHCNAFNGLFQHTANGLQRCRLAHKAFIYLVSRQRSSWEFATSLTHRYLRCLVTVLLKCDYVRWTKKPSCTGFCELLYDETQNRPWYRQMFLLCELSWSIGLTEDLQCILESVIVSEHQSVQTF